MIALDPTLFERQWFLIYVAMYVGCITNQFNLKLASYTAT